MGGVRALAEHETRLGALTFAGVAILTAQITDRPE